jgi:hypothetical protein
VVSGKGPYLSSSTVGSLPSFKTNPRSSFDIREMISNKCTGNRMVLDWSEIERVTACRILIVKKEMSVLYGQSVGGMW